MALQYAYRHEIHDLAGDLTQEERSQLIERTWKEVRAERKGQGLSTSPAAMIAAARKRLKEDLAARSGA